MDGDEVGSEEVGSEGMVTGERKERKKEKKKKGKNKVAEGNGSGVGGVEQCAATKSHKAPRQCGTQSKNSSIILRPIA